MKSLVQKIVLFLLLQCGTFAMAQVKFSANILPQKIGKNENAQLRLLVENANDVQQIVPPSLKNFIILSGPNEESGMSMINGSVKKYFAINYIIKPKTPGTFIIPATMAKADGVIYRSNPVTINVSNKNVLNNNQANNGFFSPMNGMNPFAEPATTNTYRDFILKKGENALDKINKNMFVKVETDKTAVYVGEPIIATYKLYTRLKSESGMSKNPSFNGFSVIDLTHPDNMIAKTEKVNGKEFNVYIIRKAQLYPLQSGNLELEPAEIENNVHFIKEEYARGQSNAAVDLFREFSDDTIPRDGLEDHKITLQSKPLNILVKPLPDTNKPENFKGAVGNFSIEANLAKNKFASEEVNELTVIIGGSGNLQLITVPEIKWPDGIESFEPKVTDQFDKTTVPVSGKKIITYPFTVTKPGNYQLPALSFSFFDNKISQYKSVVTKPVDFTVLTGTGKRQNIPAENSQVKKLFLDNFFNNSFRMISLIAVIFILILLFWLKRQIKKDKKNESSLLINDKSEHQVESIPEVFKELENPLAAAEECLQKQDGSTFYPTLNQSMRNYLSYKLNILPEELNKKIISEKLDSKGVRNDISLQVLQLMDDIEWQLYTPFSENEKMQEMYNRANGLIQLLNMYKN